MERWYSPQVLLKTRWLLKTKKFLRRQWISPLLGIVLSIAVLDVWQKLRHEEVMYHVQSSIPNIILLGGLSTAWMLALLAYLAQRSEQHARQTWLINRQLQVEIAERQQIEQELRRSEVEIHGLSDRLQLAVKSSQIGIWDWDITNDILIWDDQMYRLYGINASHCLGVYEAWRSALHPDDFERVTTAIRQALQGEKDYDLEFRVIHPDGTIRFIQAYAIVQRNAQGQAYRMIGVNFDITEHKQAAAALQKELLRSNMLFNTSIDGVVILNHQGNVMQTSPSFAQMLGYTVEELLNLNVADWDAQWSSKELQQIREQDFLPPVFETRHRRKDGSIYDTEISYSRVVLETEIIHFCICRDISDRKQAEIALQNSQARFAGILEIASDAIISVNQDQQITLFNQGAERIFGYTSEEILGQPLSILMPDRFALVHRQHVHHYAASNGNARPMARRGEIWGRRKDGTEFPAEASISKLNLNGEVVFTTFLRDITARQQAESAIAHLAAIIEFSEDAIVSKSLEGTITSWNAAAEKLLGYNAAEIVGQSVTVLIPEFLVAEEANILQRIRDGKRVPSFDTQRRKKDGTMVAVSISISPIKDSHGSIIGASTIVRDIRQRVQLEAQRQEAILALRESEERFQAFMQHAPLLSWITDSEGKLLYANSAFFELVHGIPETAIGQSITALFPEPLAEEYLRNNRQVLETQTGLATIELAPRRDGSMGRFLVYKFPIPAPFEQLLVGGAAIDITQQHQAEEELRHQKEMFQAIVDNIPVMIALFNEQGRIDFINPELKRILGWSLEEWQQRDVMVDLYPDPLYRQGVLDHMTAALGNWRDFTTLTAAKQPIETSWTNVPISEGRFLGIGQDVSDRKHKEFALQQAMEAAEAANLAKSMFLANMSHELRTPLNVILGFAQVMAHDPSLTASQKEDLQTIRRSGDHLLALINDVLDLSKIEAGHFSLEEAGFDLIALLHTLRTMMAERAQAKHLHLVFDIAATVPQFVIADEQKLRQVLLNLLSNAIKFTNQGSVILRATSQESQDQVCPPYHPPQRGYFSEDLVLSPSYILQFDVIDTGVGIAGTEQDTIFDAFVQAEAGKQSFTGTGLGLTISRKLLEIMNGTIAVHSTPNRGSTFTVTVPVCPTSGVNRSLQHVDRTVIGLIPGQPHRRILVVDDQVENRQLMVRLLTQLGLEVRQATNGQEAISTWQTWKPDLTWMDIRMPGLDGYEATRQIRAIEQEQEPASVIIALTAQASQSDRTLALAAGCDDYISKPFREGTVFLKMAEYLGLQYIYAESEGSAPPTTPPLGIDPMEFNTLDPVLLDHLPHDWFPNLQDAALGGNDRAIVDLTTLLPPELRPLSHYLADLANNFQFEQILTWISTNARGNNPHQGKQ